MIPNRIVRAFALLSVLVASAGSITNCAENATADGPVRTDETDGGSHLVDASAVPTDASQCGAGAWCSVKLPSSQVSLNGIWGAGPNDVWIMGSPSTAIHWDGAQIATNEVDSNKSLLGIWGSGPRDLWTFGTIARMWHYAGDVTDGGWSRSTDSGGGYATPLTAIWGAGPTDIWAIGTSAPSVFHCDGWNNGEPDWQISPTSPAIPPLIETIAFNAISGSERAGVWIVGDGGRTRYTPGWSGDHATWNAVESHSQRSLYAVWASPNGDVWAAGEGGIVHRFSRADGGNYSETTVETPASTSLRGLWGSADDDIWAVGDASTVIHWDGTAWSRVDDPVFGQGGTDLFAVWGSSKNDLWIAGRGVLLHNGAVALPGVAR